jgi:hypothetical protein
MGDAHVGRVSEDIRTGIFTGDIYANIGETQVAAAEISNGRFQRNFIIVFSR